MIKKSQAISDYFFIFFYNIISTSLQNPLYQRQQL